MAELEISGRHVCSRCGRAYGRLKGYFLVSYAELHKGIGYMPVCKECVDEIYNGYIALGVSPGDAVRQSCRKLDIYWNPTIFNAVERTNTPASMMTSYIRKVNGVKSAGKSYDDTLREEGVLWIWPANYQVSTNPSTASDIVNKNEEEQGEQEEVDIPDDVIAFWGPGYTPAMYQELQQRYEYWMTRFPQNVELDIGTEMLIKQICILEIDSIRDRAAGKPVDKYVTAINTIVGSLGLKPTQKKAEEAELGLNSTPLGVWLYRYENKRPLPEIDDDLKDSKRVIGFMQTWVLGHLCKMLGIKNSYCKMYEDEIARLRVEKPEYDDEDDDTLISDYLLNGDDADEQV